MFFGQLVIGPPGSGKTTYCNAMSQFLKAVGRKVAVVNIDPANDVLPYKADLDISEMIKVEEVMESLCLGPNGGLIYAMEFIEKNFDWVLQKLKEFSGCYLLFDCPGQVELYTHHRSFHNIVASLMKSDIRLAAVHLVDSHYCSNPGKFISVLLTSLSTMLQMEMPHINVLSKADIIEKYEKLHFNIDFYTEVLELSHLLDQLSDDPILSRFKKLNEALVGVVEDYSLVSFLALSVDSKKSMWSVLKAADKANGYVFGCEGENRNIQALLSCAVGADYEYCKTADIREAYMDTSSNVNNTSLSR